MANIITYLNRFMTARKGKDVRQDFHDCVLEINKEVENDTDLANETKTRQDALERKYDAQIAELANKDPQLPEIVDARQGYDTLGEAIKQKIYYFNTVAEMKASSKLQEGDACHTLGYYNPNDGGASLYRIVNDEELVEDGGRVHDLDNGLKAKFVLKYWPVNVRQFGAYGDGVHDDTAAIQNVLDNYRTAYISQGVYNVTTLHLNHHNELVGENKWSTILYSTSEYIIDSDKRWLTIKNLQLKSDVYYTGSQNDEIQVGSGTNGIRLNYTHDHTWNGYDTKIYLSDLILQYLGGTAVTVAGTITGCRLTNVDCTKIGETAFYIPATDSKIVNCGAAICGKHGFDIGGTATHMSNCKACLCGNRTQDGYGIRLTGDYSMVASCNTEENYSTGLQVNCNCANIVGLTVNGAGNWGKYSNVACVKVVGSNNNITGTLTDKSVECYSKYGLFIDKGTNNYIHFQIRELYTLAREAVNRTDMIYCHGWINNPFNTIILNNKRITPTTSNDAFDLQYVSTRSASSTGGITTNSDGTHRLTMGNASSVSAGGQGGVSVTFPLNVSDVQANPIIAVYARVKCNNNPNRWVEMAINGNIKRVVNGESKYYTFEDTFAGNCHRESSQEYTDIFYVGDLSSHIDSNTTDVELKLVLTKISDELNDDSLTFTADILECKYALLNTTNY